MKIIFKNLKKKEIKLKAENLDDLWYLSNIIDKEDLIKGRTIRKIKLEKEAQRKAQIIKKPVTLTIEVEKIEFHKYSDSLRASGKIIQGTEDVPKGSYHTIDIKENTIITIIKPRWYSYQLKKLEEASKELKSKILIVVFDREDASFALLKRSGYDLLLDLHGEVQKKQVKEKKENIFYKQIVKQIKSYVKKYDIKYIIIASPAFWKEYLLKEIPEELKNIITQASCSDTGKKGIEEVLKRSEVRTVLKQDQTIKEVNLVEDLLKEIAKNKLAVYGIKETKKAAEYGAIKILLVTDDLIHKLRQEDKFEGLNNIMKTTDSKKGEVHIISTEHEAGKKLKGIGGIGAILRYQIT